MASKKEPECPGARSERSSTPEARKMSFDVLRSRAQQLSLREQLERQNFLLERLNAASARLIQAVEQGQVCGAIGEIIGNLIGSEEIAVFQYRETEHAFSLAWSTGLEDEILRQFALGAGLVGRAAREGASQFRDRSPAAPLLPCEQELTACIALRLDRQVIGVIVILRLLPQKNGLDWTDFELLKFLETYGAVALQLQSLESGTGSL